MAFSAWSASGIIASRVLIMSGIRACASFKRQLYSVTSFVSFATAVGIHPWPGNTPMSSTKYLSVICMKDHYDLILFYIQDQFYDILSYM